MKTKYLDKEIELLNSIKRNHEISDYGQEKLNEFIAIKKQLLLHNISQQRESLVAVFEKMTQPQITMLEIGDYEELADELLTGRT